MPAESDADEDAIQRVIANGSDQSKPMDIDFMIACDTVADAKKIIGPVESLGYSTSITEDPDDEAVTCYCSRNMMLDYAEIVLAQRELDRIAGEHNSFIDGWGTFGNAPDR